jgi:PST family polysaccharide transporter
MTTSQKPGEPSLAQRVVSGTGWSSIAAAARQLLSLVGLGILARILGPDAYGLMGMANIVMVFLINFRDLGTAAAVVQRREISSVMISSLFWVNAALGVVLGAVVFAIAIPAARFFNQPQLAPVLWALSLAFPIASAGVVHNALLTRHMQFREAAIVDMASAVTGYGVAVPMALAGFGVWSLVASNLTNGLVSTSLYWWFARFRPALKVDRAEIRSVAGFSLHLSGFGLVNYFARYADNLVVGRFLGKDPLAFYQMAYNLMLFPLQNISSVVAQVLLPAFSRLQDDNERFRDAYVRSSMLIALITFPAMIGMAVLADPLVTAVLGAKWKPAVPIFEILAPVGMAQSVQSLVGHIYIAKGRTDWMFRWNIGATCVLVAAFFVGVRFGTIGVALAYAISYFGILLVPALLIPFRLIGLRLSTFALRLLPQVAISIAMGLIAYLWLAMLRSLHWSNAWLQLASTTAIGAASYVLMLSRLRPGVVLEFEETVRRIPSARFLRIFGFFPADFIARP